MAAVASSTTPATFVIPTDPKALSYADIAAAPSSSGVVALPAAPPELPYFESAVAVTTDQHFEVMQRTAAATQSRLYKPAYTQLPITMKTYADTWSLNPDAVNQEEFNKRLKVVIIFEAHTKQAVRDLTAITRACDQAVASSRPTFVPDIATLEWIAQLAPLAKDNKGKPARIIDILKTQAIHLLKTNVSALSAHRADMADRAKKITDAYYNMKLPLESIATRLRAAQSNVVSNVVSVVGRAAYSAVTRNATPLLDSLRDQQKQILGIIDPNGEATVEQTNREIVDKLRESLEDANLNALGSVAPNDASSSTGHDPSDNKEET